MKTFLVLAAASAIGVGLAAAATNAPSATYTYRTGTDTNPHNVDSQLTKAIPAGKSGAVPTSKFAPRPAGVAADLYHKGPVVLSPLAPPSYGYGEKNLTAAAPGALGTDTRSNPGKPPEFGGLRIFGWDF